MECLVLNTLKWDVDSINALDFMDLYLFKLHFLLPKRQAIINLIHHCYICKYFIIGGTMIIKIACIFICSTNIFTYSKFNPRRSLCIFDIKKLKFFKIFTDNFSLAIDKNKAQ